MECTLRKSFIFKKKINKSCFYYDELTAFLLLDYHARRGETSVALATAVSEVSVEVLLETEDREKSTGYTVNRGQ